jgi:hypothetical protein
MNIELTCEQANAVRYALFLHTKDDSIKFPSTRVALIRDAINILDKALEEEGEGDNSVFFH